MADGNAASRPTHRSPWSAAEVDAMRRLYPRAPRAEVCAALPGRTWCGIERAAKRHGVSRGEWWTHEEDALVVKHTSQNRGRRNIDWPATLAALPGRGRGAIITRRGVLGLRVGAGGVAWSEREDKVILNDFAEDGRRTLLEKLPGRTWHAIALRARRLGLSCMPQGWEPLKVAAERALYEAPTARRIIGWANAWAPVVEALCAWGHAVALMVKAAQSPAPAADKKERLDAFDSGAVATRKYTTTSTPTCKRSDTRTTNCWTLVEVGALDLAAAHWCAWETTGDAERRCGVARAVVRAALVREGYLSAATPHAAKMPPSWVDDALARRPRKVTR